MWGGIGLESTDDASTSGDMLDDDDESRLWGGYSYGQTWKTKARVEAAGQWEAYVMALYVALNNIFGGSCEINPGNFLEFYVQAAMLLLGSAVWAYVISSSCGIIATLNPSVLHYRHLMDELNYFAR